MKRPRSDNCDDFVDDIINNELGRASANPRPKKKQKRQMKGVTDSVKSTIKPRYPDSGDGKSKKKPKIWIEDAKISPPGTSTVHDGLSPLTVDSKRSSILQSSLPIRSLCFSNDEKGEPESSIVKKRLKYLCRIEEPTVNVGIEMVGAAYLLKLMATKSDDNKKIECAMEQAVEAAKLLFHADHLRNNALQRLSKLSDEFL